MAIELINSIDANNLLIKLYKLYIHTTRFPIRINYGTETFYPFDFANSSHYIIKRYKNL